MTDDADSTLKKLRSVSKSLKQGNLGQVLSKMEKMNPSCGICNDYISDGKEIVREAITQCAITDDNGGNEECIVLKGQIVELVNLLEEAYMMDV